VSTALFSSEQDLRRDDIPQIPLICTHRAIAEATETSAVDQRACKNLSTKPTIWFQSIGVRPSKLSIDISIPSNSGACAAR
jgi:hypothetical protein